MYTWCTDELPTWTRWLCRQCTAGLLNGPWINTADTADFVIFSTFFFFFIFTTNHEGPTVTLDFYFEKPKIPTRAGVNLWHHSVPFELKGNCQGTAGSWDSSGSHFGPIGSGQRTIVGGDWEMNKQQVSQQYSPVDMVSSRARGGKTASERLWRV